MTSSFHPRIRPLIKSISIQLVDVETEIRKLDKELQKESLYISSFHEYISDLMHKWLDDEVSVSASLLQSFIDDVTNRTNKFNTILLAPFQKRIEVDEKLKFTIERIDSLIRSTVEEILKLIGVIKDITKPKGDVLRILIDMKKKLEPFAEKAEKLSPEIRSISEVVRVAIEEFHRNRQYLEESRIIDKKETEMEIEDVSRLPKSVFLKRIFTNTGIEYQTFTIDDPRHEKILQELEKENIRDFLIEKWTEMRKLFPNQKSSIASSSTFINCEICKQNNAIGRDPEYMIAVCSARCQNKIRK